MPKKTVKKKPVKPVKKPAPKAAAKPVKKPLPKVVVKKAAPKVAPKAPVKKAAAPPPPAPAKKPVLKKPVVEAKPKKSVPPPKPIPEKVAKKPKKEEAPEVVEAPVVEAADDEEEAVEEVVLTDAEGRRYCRVKDCDQLATVDGYCRYHYLLYWKKIQIRKKILSEGKLERYVEELTSRYPDKFLDMLRKDLRSEKEFLAAIQELEIDESANENEFEDEAQTYIDEVRGIAEPGAREEEDF